MEDTKKKQEVLEEDDEFEEFEDGEDNKEGECVSNCL